MRLCSDNAAAIAGELLDRTCTEDTLYTLVSAMRDTDLATNRAVLVAAFDSEEGRTADWRRYFARRLAALPLVPAQLGIVLACSPPAFPGLYLEAADPHHVMDNLQALEYQGFIQSVEEGPVNN